MISGNQGFRARLNAELTHKRTWAGFVLILFLWGVGVRLVVVRLLGGGGVSKGREGATWSMRKKEAGRVLFFLVVRLLVFASYWYFYQGHFGQENEVGWIV